MADARPVASGGDEGPRRKPKAMPGTTGFKSKNFGEFLRETQVEVVKKTTWPTRPELAKSTSVVLAVIIGVSLYLATWDFVMSEFTKLLIH